MLIGALRAYFCGIWRSTAAPEEHELERSGEAMERSGSSEKQGRVKCDYK